MKQQSTRWLLAFTTTALLLLGAGLPAKAQFVVADPSVIASDLVNLTDDLAEAAKRLNAAKEQYQAFIDVYNKVSDLVDGYRYVKQAYKALDDISKIPSHVLRNQRNNKYLYDYEKLKSYKQTKSIMLESMDLISEIKRFVKPSSSSSARLTEGDRLAVVKDLCDEVISLRNRAYQVVYKYDLISERRAKKANTRHLFDQLNGYK